MKKVIALLLLASVLVAFGVGSFTASAESIDDIIKKFENNSPIAHYIIGDIKNLAKTIQFTDSQLTGISKLVDDFLALGITDLGPTAHLYSHTQEKEVVALLNKFCSLMGFTYKIDSSKDSIHLDDIVVTIYDASGKQIYSFDGDLVSKTGLAETTNTTLPLTIGGGCVVLAAICAVLATKKTKAGLPA